MNCFNLDPEGKGLTHGIPTEGIDGISLGGSQMVMFRQSDLVPNLREMTLNNFLVDADLSDDEIIKRREGSKNTLVRLKLLTGESPTERLYEREGQLSVRGYNRENEVHSVVGPVRWEQAKLPERKTWTYGVQILMSLPSTGGEVIIEWYTLRKQGPWWRKTEKRIHYIAFVLMRDGKPVFQPPFESLE
jgi:hypothetical protein